MYDECILHNLVKFRFWLTRACHTRSNSNIVFCFVFSLAFAHCLRWLDLSAINWNYKYSTTYIISHDNGNIERFFIMHECVYSRWLNTNWTKEDTSRSFNTPIKLPTLPSFLTSLWVMQHGVSLAFSWPKIQENILLLNNTLSQIFQGFRTSKVQNVFFAQIMIHSAYNIVFLTLCYGNTNWCPLYS